ncbi:MAG TPA: HAD-IIIA family hydrolase [Bacteroidales bacterium]|nr:HAD-IIIA family hydrolase [Bacteroidales bacterium]
MKCFFSENFYYLSAQRNLDAAKWSEATGISEKKIKDFLSKKDLPDAAQLVKISEFLNFPLSRLLTEDISANEHIIKTFDFKFLVLDIDGVMTDGGIIYTEAGDEIKKFNAKDGLAIISLVNAGYQVGFLSSGFTQNTIKHRAEVLGVKKVYIGTWKKMEILEKWCEELKISLANVAYIGDDLNDIPVIDKVGLSACPADAAEEVKEKVNMVLSLRGGQGCVREFADKYLTGFRKTPF